LKLLFRKPREQQERRAPLTPPQVEKLKALELDLDLDLELMVEAGLGLGAKFEDEAYREAGATVTEPDASTGESDLLVTIEPIGPEVISHLKSGAAVLGMLAPLTHVQTVRAARDANVSLLSMEFLPRISRAQSMDVLSSQASIGGYKAVIMAADRCSKMLPMMMTAAGTLSPSKVLVLGAGVAGLQAIATAKRLGAVVEAYDVRAATKEQVQSLGARFIELNKSETGDAETAGGYAREQTEEEKRQQQELLAKHIVGADIVVTTAAVFGKAPPVLIEESVVRRMARGAIVVDLAASADYGRGNCELTRPGEEITTDEGVLIVGTLNLPASVPTHASQALSTNIGSLIKELVDQGQWRFDLDDEIISGVAVVHGGEIRNELVKQAAQTD